MSAAHPAPLAACAARAPSGAAWAALPARARARTVARLRRAVARDAAAIAACVAEDCGRPAFEALTQEVLPLLETCRYLERRMPRWLRPRHTRYLRPGFLRTRLELTWRPLGCVAVIAPGNFPFSLGLMSTVYMLLAGNTVVLKPSERAPRTAARIERLLHAAGLAPGVVQVRHGGPEAGRRLVAEAGVDKVVFFGRTPSARQVERACAARGISCVLESGAGSAAVVLADADLGRSAAGLAWSACYANGAACVGTRHVLAQRSIAAPLAARMREEAARLGAPASLLPPVEPVAGAQEALARLAARPGLLAVSLWTRDVRRARALARTLPVGMLWVNDCSFGLPNLPWGGRGRAGRGTLFSRHALHEAGWLQWVAVGPARGRRPWWQPYAGWKRRAAALAARLYRR